jgi:hypothetical protein
MLATVIGFLFLYVVALVNLCLGFAAAAYLGCGPRLGTFAIRLPSWSTSSLRNNRHEPSADRSGATQRQNDTSAEKSDLLQQESASAGDELRDIKTLLSAVVERVSDQLQTAEAALQEVTAKLADADGAPAEGQPEALATEIDNVAQCLLKQLNTAVDELQRAGATCAEDFASRDALVAVLDTGWAQLNQLAVQLVTLSLDEQPADESSAQLAATAEEMRATCRKVLQSLATPSAKLPSATS